MTPMLSTLLVRLSGKGIRVLVTEIAARHGVTIVQIFGKDRHDKIALARHHVWHALRELDAREWSLPRLGAFFGRHHTTILQGISSFEFNAGLTTDHAKMYAAKRSVRKAAHAASRVREVA